MSFFFFQAEDGIRDVAVTGVQTCALPISAARDEQDGVRGRQGEPRCEPLAGRNREANAAEDGGPARGPAGGVRVAAPADAREGEGRGGGGGRAGDAREGQGAGRGEQTTPGIAHTPAHPEQGDRQVERHPAAVHWRRGGPLSPPEGPRRREWGGALHSPRALRHGRTGETLEPPAHSGAR